MQIFFAKNFHNFKNQNKMTINEKIQYVIDARFDGNKSAFGRAIDLIPSAIDNLVGRRQGKPSFEVLQKICSIQEINLEWLIRDSGEPFVFAIEEFSGSDQKFLISLLKEKELLLMEQSKEIGRLEEKIKQLEKQKDNNVSIAPGSSIVSVG